MRYAGKLPQSIEISNNEDWQDGIEFVLADGTPAADLTPGSILIALRRSAKESADADLVFDQSWLSYSDNTVSWIVPYATMKLLDPDDYDMEVISDSSIRRVTIRGSVCVKRGINP
jgi:hypothetical protein